jgi:hypothetical protein
MGSAVIPIAVLRGLGSMGLVHSTTSGCRVRRVAAGFYVREDQFPIPIPIQGPNDSPPRRQASASAPAPPVADLVAGRVPCNEEAPATCVLTFVQFEREVIRERVRDKFAASKRRGIWVGGPVPLGYAAVAKKVVVGAFLKVVPVGGSGDADAVGLGGREGGGQADVSGLDCGLWGQAAALGSEPAGGDFFDKAVAQKLAENAHLYVTVPSSNVR